MKIHRYDLVDSTNAEAKRLLAAGRVTGPTAVVARGQTAGRGTHGRTWVSPRDAGVYLSLVVTDLGDASPAAALLTLAAGVGCVEAIEVVTGLDVRLKPINDLWAGDGKLGGILVETSVESGRIVAAVIGVGINLRRLERRLEPGAATPVSLEDLLAPAAFRQLDVGVLVEALLARVSAWTARAAGGATRAVRDAWCARCVPGAVIPDAGGCSV